MNEGEWTGKKPESNEENNSDYKIYNNNIYCNHSTAGNIFKIKEEKIFNSVLHRAELIEIH